MAVVHPSLVWGVPTLKCGRHTLQAAQLKRGAEFSLLLLTLTGGALHWGKSPLAEELTHQHPHFWFPARRSGASASLLCDWAICQEEDTGQNWTVWTLMKSAKLWKSRNLLFFLISRRVARVFPKLISPLLFLQLIPQLIFPEKRKKHRKTTWN